MLTLPLGSIGLLEERQMGFGIPLVPPSGGHTRGAPCPYRYPIPPSPLGESADPPSPRGEGQKKRDTVMLESCWTQIGALLGNDAWFVVPGVGILAYVGLMLDSCWTQLGLSQDSCRTGFDLFLIQFS